MTGIKRKRTPFSCLAPALLVMVVAVYSLGQPMASSFVPGRWRLLSVVTGSMEPVLPVGALIVVQQAPHHPLEPDSIITFQSGDIFITHRIVDVGHDGEYYYITRGDANLNPDPQTVRPYQVVGEVDSIMPAYLSAALHLIRNPVAQLALIPTLFIFVLSMFRPYRYN